MLPLCYRHATKLLHPVAMRSRARTSCCSFCGRNCCRKVSSSRLQCSMGRYEGFCCSGDYDRRRIWGTNCLHMWPVAVHRQRRWCHFQRPHSIIRLIDTPLMMTQVLFFKVVALFSAAFISLILPSLSKYSCMQFSVPYAVGGKTHCS